MMEVFEKVDWDNVDYQKIVGSYVPLPDGRKQYVELSMLHWSWIDFCEKEAETTIEELVAPVVQTLEEENEPPETWDETFQFVLSAGILAFAKAWIKDSTGRIPAPLFAIVEEETKT
jgi:hypothetical protein